jgi:hypothetical protein
MINESLRANDLRGFIKKIIEVDAFKSKIGDDEDIVTISFTVDQEDPAKDLENFIEMGFDFVLDADVSPGELDDGTYKVYVELERSRHVPEQIREILDGVEKISGIDNFKFRYFKNFKSQEATEDNLAAAIPLDKNSYDIATERSKVDNFQEFFSRSYVDDIQLLDESISFKRVYGGKVLFNIITSGTTKEVFDELDGPFLLESKSMAEVMFLTKYIGNYNITKVGNAFVFENNGWAVALERKE